MDQDPLASMLKIDLQARNQHCQQVNALDFFPRRVILLRALLSYVQMIPSYIFAVARWATLSRLC